MNGVKDEWRDGVEVVRPQGHAKHRRGPRCPPSNSNTKKKNHPDDKLNLHHQEGIIKSEFNARQKQIKIHFHIRM